MQFCLCIDVNFDFFFLAVVFTVYVYYFKLLSILLCSKPPEVALEPGGQYISQKNKQIWHLLFIHHVAFFRRNRRAHHNTIWIHALADRDTRVTIRPSTKP